MGQTVGQYLGKTKGPVINQMPVSDAYRENAAESQFEKFLRTGKPDESFPEWKAREEKAMEYLVDVGFYAK